MAIPGYESIFHFAEMHERLCAEAYDERRKIDLGQWRFLRLGLSRCLTQRLFSRFRLYAIINRRRGLRLIPAFPCFREPSFILYSEAFALFLFFLFSHGYLFKEKKSLGTLYHPATRSQAVSFKANYV